MIFRSVTTSMVGPTLATAGLFVCTDALHVCRISQFIERSSSFAGCQSVTRCCWSSSVSNCWLFWWQQV